MSSLVKIMQKFTKYESHADTLRDAANIIDSYFPDEYWDVSNRLYKIAQELEMEAWNL